MYCYTIHALVVRSTIALAGCAELEDRAADLTIRAGQVPVSLPGGEAVQGCFQAADDRLLLSIPDAGRFLVGCDEVVYEKAPHATDSDLGAVLVGIVLAVVLQKKNRFALHASALEWQGRAVLFCGLPGTGKSILAASLLEKGARFISDDLTAISLREGVAYAVPGPRHLSLWPDSLLALGRRPGDYERLRPAVEKRLVPVADAAVGEIPIGSVFFLQRRAKHDLADCVKKPGPSDSLALFGNALCQPLGILGKGSAFPHFGSAALVASQARLHVLDRKHRDPDLDATMALVSSCLAAT